jgi:hypothetical protein
MADTTPSPGEPAADPGTPPSPESLAAHHEMSDASPRGVIGFAAVLVAVAIVVHLVLAWMFFAYQARGARDKASRFPLATAKEQEQLPQTRFGSPVTGALPEPAPQRLEGLNPRDPAQGEAGALITAQEQKLNSAGPAEGKGAEGFVHIPIQDAMRLVVEESKGQQGKVPYERGVPGTGGGSNSGRTLPEGRR